MNVGNTEPFPALSPKVPVQLHLNLTEKGVCRTSVALALSFTSDNEELALETRAGGSDVKVPTPSPPQALPATASPSTSQSATLETRERPLVQVCFTSKSRSLVDQRPSKLPTDLITSSSPVGGDGQEDRSDAASDSSTSSAPNLIIDDGPNHFEQSDSDLTGEVIYTSAECDPNAEPGFDDAGTGRLNFSSPTDEQVRLSGPSQELGSVGENLSASRVADDHMMDAWGRLDTHEVQRQRQQKQNAVIVETDSSGEILQLNQSRTPICTFPRICRETYSSNNLPKIQTLSTTSSITPSQVFRAQAAVHTRTRSKEFVIKSPATGQKRIASPERPAGKEETNLRNRYNQSIANSNGIPKCELATFPRITSAASAQPAAGAKCPINQRDLQESPIIKDIRCRFPTQSHDQYQSSILPESNGLFATHSVKLGVNSVSTPYVRIGTSHVGAFGYARTSSIGCSSNCATCFQMRQAFPLETKMRGNLGLQQKAYLPSTSRCELWNGLNMRFPNSQLIEGSLQTRPFNQHYIQANYPYSRFGSTFHQMPAPNVFHVQSQPWNLSFNPAAVGVPRIWLESTQFSSAPSFMPRMFPPLPLPPCPPYPYPQVQARTPSKPTALPSYSALPRQAQNAQSRNLTDTPPSNLLRQMLHEQSIYLQHDSNSTNNNRPQINSQYNKEMLLSQYAASLRNATTPCPIHGVHSANPSPSKLTRYENRNCGCAYGTRLQLVPGPTQQEPTTHLPAQHRASMPLGSQITRASTPVNSVISDPLASAKLTLLEMLQQQPSLTSANASSPERYPLASSVITPQTHSITQVQPPDLLATHRHLPALPRGPTSAGEGMQTIRNESPSWKSLL